MATYTYGQPKSPYYNPYSTTNRPPVVHQPQTRSSPYATSPQSCSRRLDRTTRTRNALILAVVVFIVAFLVCLILLIIYMPKLLSPPVDSSQTKVTFQVVSTLKNSTYDAKLSDSSSYPAVLMNTTFCSNLIEAVKPVTTVLTCNVIEYSDATPGVKSTMNVTASLGDQTEDKMFTDISTAIVASAAEDPNWEVTAADITLIPYLASLAIRHVIQLHLLLCWLLLLHNIL